MTTPIRHGGLGVLACVVLSLAGPVGGVARAAAAGVGDARIATTYVMHGRVTTAVRVRDEHRGQLVTRRWAFTGLSCSGSVCQQLALRRQRSANHYDRLILSRGGGGGGGGPRPRPKAKDFLLL
jgi:hypothetical protein